MFKTKKKLFKVYQNYNKKPEGKYEEGNTMHKKKVER
jgi:hypothetical protein